jgi:hypothetical protein
VAPARAEFQRAEASGTADHGSDANRYCKLRWSTVEPQNYILLTMPLRADVKSRGALEWQAATKGRARCRRGSVCATHWIGRRSAAQALTTAARRRGWPTRLRSGACRGWVARHERFKNGTRRRPRCATTSSSPGTQAPAWQRGCEHRGPA